MKRLRTEHDQFSRNRSGWDPNDRARAAGHQHRSAKNPTPRHVPATLPVPRPSADSGRCGDMRGVPESAAPRTADDRHPLLREHSPAARRPTGACEDGGPQPAPSRERSCPSGHCSPSGMSQDPGSAAEPYPQDWRSTAGPALLGPPLHTWRCHGLRACLSTPHAEPVSAPAGAQHPQHHGTRARLTAPLAAASREAPEMSEPDLPRPLVPAGRPQYSWLWGTQSRGHTVVLKLSACRGHSRSRLPCREVWGQLGRERRLLLTPPSLTVSAAASYSRNSVET